jgi:GNAT superfamily N-acetyltransferase
MIRLFDRWRRRGFVGPRYEGIIGRLRFLYQHFVTRTDIVLLARSDVWTPQIGQPSELVLQWIDRWEDLTPYAPALDAEYFEGFTRGWQPIFGWGEKLALAMLDDRVAGFGWVQTGSAEGLFCEYTLLWEGDRRVLRVGVLPSQRGRGVNTRFYSLLLDQLFSSGAGRVLIDCTVDNVPSLRAQMKAGFRPIGALHIRGAALGSGVVWRPIRPGDLPASP